MFALVAAMCCGPAPAAFDGSLTGTLVSGRLAGRWCTPPVGAVARLDLHSSGSHQWLDVGGVVIVGLHADGSVARVAAAPDARLPSTARWTAAGNDMVEIDGRVDATCRFDRAVVRFEGMRSGAPPQLQARLQTEAALSSIDAALARGASREAIAGARALPEGVRGLPGMRLALVRAQVAIDGGDDAAAAALLAGTTATVERVAGSAHPSALYAVSLEAARLHVRAEYDASLALRERLAESYAAAGDADDADRLANEIGRFETLLDRGDMDAARAMLEPAVAEARTLLGPIAPVTLRGELALARGSTRPPRETAAHLLALHAAVAGGYGAEAPLGASVLFAHAIAAERSGDLHGANASLERAHAVRARALGDDHPRTLALLEYLAFVRAQLNRIDDAVAVQRTVLHGNRALYGHDHPRSVLAAQNLGIWLVALERSVEAMPLLAMAHDAMAQRFGDAHQRTIDALLDRADASLAVGDVGRGCAEFGNAERLAAASALEEQGERARFGLGRCALATSRPDDAVRIFEDVARRRQARVGSDSEETLATLSALARARIAVGDNERATSDLRDLLARSEALRAREAPQSGGGRAAFARRVGGTLELAGYRDLAWLRAVAGDANEAIRIAELARARDLGEALQLRGVAVDTRLPTRERVALVRYSEALRAIDAALAVAPVASAEHSELSRHRAAIASDLERAHAAIARPDASRAPADALALVRTLPSDVAVVGIQSSYAGDWIYALRRGQAPRIAMIAETLATKARASLLREALVQGPLPFSIAWRTADARWTLALARPEPDASAVPLDLLALGLGRDLFAGVAASLRGAKRVVVVADGVYSRIPAELLGLEAVTSNVRVETSYAPSLAAIAALRARSADPGKRPIALVAIGAPDYARMGTRGPGPLDGLAWPPLPGAARELAELRAIFGTANSRFVDGREATRSALVSSPLANDLESARLVHIAAHGILAARSPQWSSLVLGADDAQGPGYVTAAELATLKLDADLVTLSACETALGRDVPGEGLFGLPYALAVAGARATLLTLWRVDDASTAEFMRRFYRRIERGERPARALAATKQEMRRHARWNAPFHWAPFVLYGI